MTSQRFSNRLARESSPYLRQHAHNPVDWFPWGPEALERARKLNRPIFLSVGYSACHWCHVMEHESFENEGIAQILNEHFVSIKVDREERPDLDQIYMAAVQMISPAGRLAHVGVPDSRPAARSPAAPTSRPRTGTAGPAFAASCSCSPTPGRQRRDDIEHAAAEITEHLQDNGQMPERRRASLHPEMLAEAAH